MSQKSFTMKFFFLRSCFSCSFSVVLPSFTHPTPLLPSTRSPFLSENIFVLDNPSRGRAPVGPEGARQGSTAVHCAASTTLFSQSFWPTKAELPFHPGHLKKKQFVFAFLQSLLPLVHIPMMISLPHNKIFEFHRICNSIKNAPAVGCTYKQ